VSYDVVIPVRDEEVTLEAVVRAARAAKGVRQVIVVDDGSSDGSAAVARRAGARVVAAASPGTPGSKGRALAIGVAASDADVLVFFDGDLRLARPEHFGALAEPVLSGRYGLSCGLVDYGPQNTVFMRLPPITGLRAMRRELFEQVAPKARHGFGIEIMINDAAVRLGVATCIRTLGGLEHRTKVQKRGWRRAIPSYAHMIWQLVACLGRVPLWRYVPYLRRLDVLPPVPRSGSVPSLAPDSSTSADAA
jgi:glycosyltransferase involved in cell wall biosynthesis